MRIGNDLIEAYKGYYEEPTYKVQMTDAEVIEKIQADTPKERLEVYLHWNGILGWANRIWEISQGEL